MPWLQPLTCLYRLIFLGYAFFYEVSLGVMAFLFSFYYVTSLGYGAGDGAFTTVRLVAS